MERMLISSPIVVGPTDGRSRIFRSSIDGYPAVIGPADGRGSILSSGLDGYPVMGGPIMRGPVIAGPGIGSPFIVGPAVSSPFIGRPIGTPRILTDGDIILSKFIVSPRKQKFRYELLIEALTDEEKGTIILLLPSIQTYILYTLYYLCSDTRNVPINDAYVIEFMNNFSNNFHHAFSIISSDKFAYDFLFNNTNNIIKIMNISKKYKSTLNCSQYFSKVKQKSTNPGEFYFEKSSHDNIIVDINKQRGGGLKDYINYISSCKPIRIVIDEFNSILYPIKKNHCDRCTEKDEKMKILIFLLCKMLIETNDTAKKFEILLESTNFYDALISNDDDNDELYEKLEEYKKYKLRKNT